MVIAASTPGGMVPKSHRTPPLNGTQLPCDGNTENTNAFVEMVLVRDTPEAVFGPWFVTDTRKLTNSPITANPPVC